MALTAPDRSCSGPATLAQLHKRRGRHRHRVRGADRSADPAADRRHCRAADDRRCHRRARLAEYRSDLLHPIGARAVTWPRTARSPAPTPSSSGCGPGSARRPGARSLNQIADQLNRTPRSPAAESVIGDHRVATPTSSRCCRCSGLRRSSTTRRWARCPPSWPAGSPPGAVAGLGLTLIASVRRRRRDFALLKTLGFTRRQLAGAVAWQSTVIAALGLVVGVPLGIAAGRWLWLAFARELSAVPDPVIPAGLDRPGRPGRPDPGQPGRRAARPGRRPHACRAGAEGRSDADAGRDPA